MRDYYKQLDNAIKSYEDFKPYHQHAIEWITNRICWCWKFRHITDIQKDELCDRVIYILDNRMF